MRLRFELSMCRENSSAAEAACRRNATALEEAQAERFQLQISACQDGARILIADKARISGELNSSQTSLQTSNLEIQRLLSEEARLHDVLVSSQTNATVAMGEADRLRAEASGLQSDLARLRIKEKAATSTSERLALEISQVRSGKLSATGEEDTHVGVSVADPGDDASNSVHGVVQAVAAAEAETERLREALIEAEVRCASRGDELDHASNEDTTFSSWSALSDAFQFDKLRNSFTDAWSWTGTTGSCWQKCLEARH